MSNEQNLRLVSHPHIRTEFRTHEANEACAAAELDDGFVAQGRRAAAGEIARKDLRRIVCVGGS